MGKLKQSVLVVVTLLVVLGGPVEVGGQEHTATISGTAYTFNTRNVIPDATIRAVEFPDVATTTAADGSYTLEFPVGSTVTLHIEAEGHEAIHLQTFTLDDDHSGATVVGANFQTPTTAVYGGLRALIASYVGQDPFEGGCVVVTTVGREELVGMPFDEFIRFAPHGVEGATATMTPTLSEPIYFNSSVVPDMAQLTTSNDGGVLWPNVPPGEYVLSASHPTVTFTTVDVRCEQGWVVNANPVWGLHAIDPTAVATTTTSTTTEPAEPGPSSSTTSPSVEDATTTSTAATDAASATTTTAPADLDEARAAGSGRDSGSPTPGSGDLPPTGTDPRSATVAAAVLLLGGAVLVALTHRRLHRW